MKRLVISLLLATALLGATTGSVFAAMPEPIPRPVVKANLYAAMPEPIPEPVGFIMFIPNSSPNNNLNILVSLHNLEPNTVYNLECVGAMPEPIPLPVETNKQGTGTRLVSCHVSPGILEVSVEGDGFQSVACLPIPIPLPPGRLPERE